ncbi:MAG: MATE family efflux transporter, partial [Catalinimonas sp.]
MPRPFATDLRRTFVLAYPLVLSQLGHIMVGVADSLMVGRLGAVPLAAISLGNSLFSLVLVTGLGLSFGLTPLVAAADGEASDAASRRAQGVLLSNSLFLNAAFGTLLGFGLSAAVPLIW